MTDTELHWPDEHVAWQQVFAPLPEMSIPIGVHVFVFHTRDQLRAACRNEKASAHSSTWDLPDSTGVGALLMLSAEDLELSLVAHEVTHIALLHHRNAMDSYDRTGARRWLTDHPESLAEMVGNLTGLIWWNLPHDDEQGLYS